MFGDADRPDAGTAATVRNAERFVQIQMANVRAVIPRAAQAALRVHVRAVHVNLPAMRVARSFACASAFARRSARLISPSFNVATETTLRPAITALAGFVPCAEVGIKQTLRCASPRDS